MAPYELISLRIARALPLTWGFRQPWLRNTKVPLHTQLRDFNCDGATNRSKEGGQLVLRVATSLVSIDLHRTTSDLVFAHCLL